VPRFLRGALILAALASLPALLPKLAYDRPGPVALVVDGAGLRKYAQANGLSLAEALKSLRRWGVTGVAFYEEHVEDRARRGRGRYLAGELLSLLAPAAGFLSGWHYTTVPGAEEIPLPQHRVVWRGETWVGFRQDVGKVPLGPPPEIDAAYRAGFWIVYRPENHPLHPWPPRLPPQTGLYVFVGTEALGWPDRLDELAAMLQAPVALIEGVRQAGVAELARKVGGIRLFSLRGEYQLKLSPAVAAGKYVLAARERGHRVLYFRPYPRPEDTRRFLARIQAGLARAGIAPGVPEVKRYRPSRLRLLAWIGVFAGLLLYLVRLPPALAWITGFFLLLLAFGYGGAQAGPLLVALVFPVLGFLEPLRGLLRWWAALGYALAGAVVLTVLGTTPETLLGLAAFKGVGLVLVLPPFLYLLAQLPKVGWQETLARLYRHPVRLGEAALAGLLLLGLAIAFLRRGNDAPFVPGLELALRDQLQALMIRPRFKEIFGHASAVFALLGVGELPRWLVYALLAFGVIAEASILDSFAHYHTPFWVSLVRSFNGALIGLLFGLGGWLAYRGVRRWLWP